MAFNLFSQSFAISSDHGGHELKEHLVKHLKGKGITNFEVLGSTNTERSDYPPIVEQLTKLVTDKKIAWGILICGSGIGVSIAANRFKGIYAANCHDTTTAKLARMHNDANILTLGGRLIGPQLAQEIVEAFAANPFSGDRYQIRKEMIDKWGTCS